MFNLSFRTHSSSCKPQRLKNGRDKVKYCTTSFWFRFKITTSDLHLALQFWLRVEITISDLDLALQFWHRFKITISDLDLSLHYWLRLKITSSDLDYTLFSISCQTCLQLGSRSVNEDGDTVGGSWAALVKALRPTQLGGVGQTIAARVGGRPFRRSNRKSIIFFSQCIKSQFRCFT